MQKLKKNKLRYKEIGFLLLLLVAVVSIFQLTKSAILEDDVEVMPNTELIYYLDVTYDGVDKYGVESSDTTTSEIKSGYIYVEDKIPDGLTFNGFVETEDGSIGAVKISDGSTCLGKVVDDSTDEETNGYHGLHYDEDTRTVSFTVTNLQAGCKLTVGIKTITPETVDDPDTEEVELRRDFYNFATAKEDSLTKNSNTVHVWMGSEAVDLYKVIYEYEGDVPDNAPDVPTTSLYAEGASVGVASDVNLSGYVFSGWSTSDATISNGSFTMPATSVTLKGSFTAINPHTVIYSIEGDVPDGYIVPSSKTYYEGDTVTVDSLEKGDIINGYRFLGWTSTNVTISDDGNFQMPSSDVQIVGSFEEVTYTVTYKFYDTVLPPNSASLLPETETYKPGDTVTLATVTEPDGYKFLGWYKETTFTMPEEDIVVYGEWKVQLDTFKPTITKQIINEKNYYNPGDVVYYAVTVTNNESFAISDVVVKEDNTNAEFVTSYYDYATESTVTGTGYTLTSTHIITIDTIAAGSSVTAYSKYTVGSSEHGTITNKVSVLGATATDHELDSDSPTAEEEFTIKSKLKVCKTVDATNIDTEKVFQIHITGTDNNLEHWVPLTHDTCETIYIEPGTYEISEVIPQEYELESITGAITSNGSTLTIAEDSEYEISFTNKYKNEGFLRSSDRVENFIRNNTGTESNPHLTVSKEANMTKTYNLGDTITYTLQVKNDGNLAVTDIILSDDLTGLEFEVGTLKPSEISEKYTVTYTVTENDVIAGKVTNVAEATGNSPDPDKPEPDVTPGVAEVPVERDGASLSVVKKTTSTPTNSRGYTTGETIVYEISVVNNGDVTVSDIVVTDTLEGATIVAGDGYTINSNGQAIIGILAPGKYVVVNAEYVVTEDDILAGSVTNTVTVTGTSEDPSNPNPSDTVTSTNDTAEPVQSFTVDKVLTNRGSGADGEFAAG